MNDIKLLGDKVEEFNPKNFTYFVKPTYYDMSNMKLEGLKKYAQIIQYGRRSPVKLAERLLGVEFLDYQQYLFMNSWITPYVVWCVTRNGAKTTIGAIFCIMKSLLIPYFNGYIIAGSGSQSIEMMQKIEKIAKREIASFTGLTDVFMNELVKNASSSSTGFVHNPNSWTYSVYSGSEFHTVNSNYDKARGKRSNLNWYDEASYIPEDMYEAVDKFTSQDADFALGGDKDVSLAAPRFPNQRVYASSMGSTDDRFYKLYKEFSLHSFAGDKRYACFDIDADVVLRATYKGKLYPVSLLTQETIDNDMKINPLKARREYYNEPDITGGSDILIKKAYIIRNSVCRPPELFNKDNSLYMIAYDPAKKRDNSMVGVGKLIHDDKRGWMMEIVNFINLIDKETRKPITTPEQVDMIRNIMISYNGTGAGDYANIKQLYIDAGAGGGATQILDFLFNDFYEEGHDDDSEYKHYGMIDEDYEYCKPYTNRYPNAVNIVTMVEPSKNKTRLFQAVEEMVSQDLVSFPMDYDHHGFLTILDEKGQNETIYTLSPEEEEALNQIDAMKEEITHMYRYKTPNGNVRYDLAAGFENKINDDRAYVLALLCGGLAQLRSEDMHNMNNPHKNDELIELLTGSMKKSCVFKK